jgi:hypothetical protein
MEEVRKDIKHREVSNVDETASAELVVEVYARSLIFLKGL